MWGFQAAGAAPIVLGHPVTEPDTIATAIRIGNPASWEQAEAARDESGGLIDSVTDEEILSRLDRRRTLEGRADDDPAAVAIRLRAYREQTAPVLEWYEQRGGVKRIPAVGTVEEIAARVRRALGK